MSRILKVFGGGVLLAAVMVALAITLQPDGPVDINFNRDVCFSDNGDRLPDSEIRGNLEPSPRTDTQSWTRSGREKEYWDELKRLIAEYPSTPAGRDYIFDTGLSFRMNTMPYRGLATGVICVRENLNICRNRNFWFFKKIPPKQLAQIVFENTVKKDIPFRKCVLKPTS